MAKLEIRSEITGTVWQVKVAVGDRVAEGDVVVVVESMKMEIPVIVEDAGVVVEVRVQPGQPLAEGEVAVVLEG